MKVEATPHRASTAWTTAPTVSSPVSATGRLAHHRREKRFPVGTSLREMKKWQENERAELRRAALRPVLGTLAADIERYLRLDVVTSLASCRTRVTDTKAWLPRFGHLRRDELTTEALQRQVNDWVAAGFAAWTIHHRRNALRQVFKALDGETAFNPAVRVKSPSKPRPIPHALDFYDIRTVFNQLRPSATKGFLMIIAFTGFRPEEIRRTETWMVHLDADEPHVIKNSAKGGDLVVVPLSPEGVLGWKMLVDHGGSTSSPPGSTAVGIRVARGRSSTPIGIGNTRWCGRGSPRRS